MATFPELVPTTRSYDFGSFPISNVPSASAGVVRFRHGTASQNYTMVISYDALSDADAALIRNHFQIQGGGFRSFALPPAIWTNHSFSGNVVPYRMNWRYIEAIEEEHFSLGFVNLTVTLGSDGFQADDDATMRVGATFIGGVATNPTSGFELSIACSFIGGPANAAPINTLALNLQLQQVGFSPYPFSVDTLAIGLQLQPISVRYYEMPVATLALVMFATNKAFTYYALNLSTTAFTLQLNQAEFVPYLLTMNTRALVLELKDVSFELI